MQQIISLLLMVKLSVSQLKTFLVSQLLYVYRGGVSGLFLNSQSLSMLSSSVKVKKTNGKYDRTSGDLNASQVFFRVLCSIRWCAFNCT